MQETGAYKGKVTVRVYTISKQNWGLNADILDSKILVTVLYSLCCTSIAQVIKASTYGNKAINLLLATSSPWCSIKNVEKSSDTCGHQQSCSKVSLNCSLSKQVRTRISLFLPASQYMFCINISLCSLLEGVKYKCEDNAPWKVQKKIGICSKKVFVLGQLISFASYSAPVPLTF